jgi:hypothetical protein
LAQAAENSYMFYRLLTRILLSTAFGLFTPKKLTITQAAETE